MKANFDSGFDEDEVDELSNSGVSTVNSAKIKHHTAKDHYDIKLLLEQVKVLKSENSKLIQEVLDSHKSFNNYLKSNDTTTVSDVLKNLVQQLSNISRNFERSISYGYHSDDHLNKSLSDATSPSPDEIDKGIPINNVSTVNSKKLNIPVPPLFRNPQLKSPLRQCHDMRLNEWLGRNGFDDEAKHAIDIADFTYEDLLYFTDKDDILRLGLRAGTGVRLWKLILAHRKRFGTYQSEIRGEQFSNGFSNEIGSNNNSYDSTSSTTTSNSSYETCNSDNMATTQ